MRKILAVLAIMAVSISTTTVAYAASSPPTSQPTQSELQQWDGWLDQFGEQFENWFDQTFGVTDPDENQGSGAVVAAPEFDPGVAMLALSLLAGGLAVVRGRRRN